MAQKQKCKMLEINFAPHFSVVTKTDPKRQALAVNLKMQK